MLVCCNWYVIPENIHVHTTGILREQWVGGGCFLDWNGGRYGGVTQFGIPKTWGVTTLTNAVTGRNQNCSGNLEISPGIGKHAIIPGHCRKTSGHQRKVSQKFGRMIQISRPSSAQTAFVGVVTPPPPTPS